METLVANTALIRRRIRNPSLTMKILSVGSLSKTDVVLCYMDDHVDHALLNKLLEKNPGRAGGILDYEPAELDGGHASNPLV